jgi:hypothetical protein
LGISTYVCCIISLSLPPSLSLSLHRHLCVHMLLHTQKNPLHFIEFSSNFSQLSQGKKWTKPTPKPRLIQTFRWLALAEAMHQPRLATQWAAQHKQRSFPVQNCLGAWVFIGFLDVLGKSTSAYVYWFLCHSVHVLCPSMCVYIYMCVYNIGSMIDI